MYPPDEQTLAVERLSTPVEEPSAPAVGEPLRACLRMALGHEVPNQFVAIQGLARVLEWEESARLSEAGKDYLRRLAVAAERAHGLIRTLADLVRPALTARASTPVPFLEVAREAAAETSQAFAQRLLNWHFAEPDQFLPVPRLALRQVLVLLLRNSVQATPRDATPSLQLGAQVHAAGWEFWVADQGRGFTAEQRAALEEFLAGRAAVPGKGFGLLFVTQVAASWGARLHVTSEPGRGCIVTVLGAH